ncbi:vesicle transport protein SEC20-like [Lytechinus variegatus]|uniref:vesicle transport protein SEC20-like n=1 Tax=Lytechinus variegatus TaxID=7654 RepID=UPI001BB156B7|nr:vesicle transport protein SEC20-like [Lytechinus variegatus]
MALDAVRIRTCVQEIVKHDLQINSYAQELRSNCKTMEILDNINVRIKAETAICKQRIEELEKIGKEQDKETDRIGLLKEADHYRKQLRNTQTAIRQANLSCKMEIDRNQRNDLMKGQEDPEVRKRKNKEDLAKTASSITESLQSLNRMMADNVERSNLTNQTLVTSSNRIQETNEEFKGMAGVIQTSRNLLTKYGRREMTDKLLIFLALALFLATVIYILKKRIF